MRLREFVLGVCLVAAAAMLWLGSSGCESKGKKAERMKEECLGYCTKQDQAHKLCAAFCEQQKDDPACAEDYCKGIEERHAECLACCEEKSAADTFVLGSCLSKADLDETMTADKFWDIRKKMVGDRRDKEKKAAVEKESAEEATLAAELGWLLELKGSGDAQTLVLARNAEGEGEEPAKLVIQCSAEEDNVFLGTEAPLKMKGDKATLKVGFGSKSHKLAVVKPSEEPLYAFADTYQALKLMRAAATMSVEAKGLKATFKLDGLGPLLAAHDALCAK